jgi:hypothetical protein
MFLNGGMLVHNLLVAAVEPPLPQFKPFQMLSTKVYICTPQRSTIGGCFFSQVFCWRWGPSAHPRQLCSSKPCASPQPLGDCELQLGLLCTLSVHWIWKIANVLCQCRPVNHPVANKFWHIWAFLQLALYTFIIASHFDTFSNSYFVYISIMVGECKLVVKHSFFKRSCLLMADHFLVCCIIGTSTLFIIAKHISILVADDD